MAPAAAAADLLVTEISFARRIPEIPATGREARRGQTGRRRRTAVRPMCTPTRPRGHRDVRARTVPRAGSWQVFGLAGTLSSEGSTRTNSYGSCTEEDTYWPSLPGSRVSDPVRMTAVVPAHRCGAVPDSHRVPSCDVPSG
ncbi:hypothetical protein TPA0906_65650 [Streptomyces olivaceus]|nr:hypothetical protein TPA0906_65650 [Streptomyces olivaceus]